MSLLTLENRMDFISHPDFVYFPDNPIINDEQFEKGEREFIIKLFGVNSISELIIQLKSFYDIKEESIFSEQSQRIIRYFEEEKIDDNQLKVISKRFRKQELYDISIELYNHKLEEGTKDQYIKQLYKLYLQNK